MACFRRRHIPRAIDWRASYRLDSVPHAVQHNQTSRLGSCGGAVGGRQTTHNHPAGTQHDESRREPDAPRTRAWKVTGIDLSKKAHRPLGRDLDNRGAGSLQIRTVVEIAHQDVPRVKVAFCVLDSRHTIWVDITIGRNRGRHDRNSQIVAGSGRVVVGLGTISNQSENRQHSGSTTPYASSHADTLLSVNDYYLVIVIGQI